jgi:hypothetical protein
MTLSLLFGVHGHQPVGNFPWVLDDVHHRCYRPFFETLYRYPDFRFSVHFSGWLLERLEERFPRSVERLAEMVERGQVELFGGGDCEPVLAAIPRRDRLGQLAALARRLERRFGVVARGAWLAERVWEASVVPALVESGIRYVTLDDYHFACTGMAAEALDGYYTTEEDARTLDVFPISERLRYCIPFSPAEEAVAGLEELAAEGRRAAIYFDDIEKFGIWPETEEWVYGRRWLERFVEGVLASPHLRAVSYREFHDTHATHGVVYLPTTSYAEMNEWALPPASARRYAELIAREKEAGRYAHERGFLRGGIWRNFLSRYPEANWMHKRMLELSQRLAAASPEQRAALTGALYRAQCNDAYWHGLFGGIYLPHLRRAVYRELIALERGLDAAAPRPGAARRDLDCDGTEELFLASPRLQAILALDGRAAIREFDSYALAHNFGDVLRRTAESYYPKVAEPAAGSAPARGIASAHERVEFRHEIAPSDLVPDSRPRGLFLDAWTADGADPIALERYGLECADADERSVRFCCALGPGTVSKQLALEDGGLVVRYALEGYGPGVFATEINLALPSSDGFGGRYILADGTIPCGFGQELSIARLETIRLDDRELRGGLVLALSPAAQFSARPHYTVSRSEAGFERIMQGVTITLSWRCDAPVRITVTMDVRPDQDGQLLDRSSSRPNGAWQEGPERR